MAYTTVVDLTFPDSGSADGWIRYRNNDGAEPSTPLVWEDDGTDKFIKSVFDKTSSIERAWWDGNHYYPGVGYLNLIAVAYFAPTLGGNPGDMTNARFTWEIRLKNFEMPHGGRLVQWVQGLDPGQGDGTNVFVNYANFGQPIDAQFFGSNAVRAPKVNGIMDSGWKTCVVDFRPSDADWICMGSNPHRTGLPEDGDPGEAAVYGCAKSFADYLKNGGKADTGIFVIYPNQFPPSRPPAWGVNGELHIRRCKFEQWG